MKIEDIEITGLTSDSRLVKPGFLFAALDSEKAPGSSYIPSAIANGAALILGKAEYASVAGNVKFIADANPNKKFSELAAEFYGPQPAHIAAITGTNGKTSIADFVRQILTATGTKAASMGTLGFIKGNQAPVPSPNTTPNAVTTAEELAKLKREGYDYVCMEMSSHGLCQYRVGGVHPEVAGFTNLTRDHLDYHKTFENYLNAKLILFREILVPGGTAVLNADIEVFPQIEKACLESGKKIITYGHNGRELRLIQALPEHNGQRLKLVYFGKEVEIFVPLAGEFQAMNILCALGMAAVLSGKPEEVIRHAGALKGAKGRLELAGTTDSGATVYIDYAHTPDALENVIRAMRPHTRGKLHVLFGCGGDRDSGKRPIMGQIANELADVIYVTDDNPRTEDAAKIREQIMAACPRGKNIPGRAEAIREAMAGLGDGDVLILAGKGHETGQYINGKVYPFSDHEEVCKNL